MTDDDLAELLARALDDDAPIEPPAERVSALRDRATARAATAPGAPDAAHRRSARARTRRWLAVAASLAGLIAGFGLARLLDDPGDDSVTGVVEFDGPMIDAEGRTARAELTVVETGIGRVVDLRTDVLPILPTGEYYQVWFVATDDIPGAPHRISAGTFHPDPDGRSHVRFAAAVNPARFPDVEVTAEPGNGNPLPNGPVVLRATIG